MFKFSLKIKYLYSPILKRHRPNSVTESVAFFQSQADVFQHWEGSNVKIDAGTHTPSPRKAISHSGNFLTARQSSPPRGKRLVTYRFSSRPNVSLHSKDGGRISVKDLKHCW